MRSRIRSSQSEGLTRRRFIGESAGAAALAAAQGSAQVESTAVQRRTQFDAQLLAGDDLYDPALAANHGRQMVMRADGSVVTALAAAKTPRISVWVNRKLAKQHQLSAAPEAPVMLESGRLLVSAGGSVFSADAADGTLSEIAGTRGALLDAATASDGTAVLAVADRGKLSLVRIGKAPVEVDRGAGRASLDFDADGNLHVAYEKKQGIEYRRYSSDGLRLLHSERVAHAFGFSPVLLAAKNGVVLAYRGESCRMPSTVKGSAAWERLGRGGYIAVLVQRDGAWLRHSAAVSQQIVKPFAPIDSAYTSGTTRELRVQYEEFSAPSLCLGPDGVVEIFWADTVRRWIYSARLLGETLSAPAEVRGPLEQLAGPCLLPRRVPRTAAAIPIGMMTARRTYLDHARRAASVVSAGRRIDFVGADELAEIHGLDLRLNQMKRRAENPVIAIDPPGGSVYDGAIVADIFRDGPGWRADLRYTTLGKASAEGDQGKSYSGRGVSDDGIRWRKLEPQPLGTQFTVDGVSDHKYTIRWMEDAGAAGPHRFKGLWRSVQHEPWGWLAVTSADRSNWKRVADNQTIVRADDDLRVWMDETDVPARRYKASAISRSFCGRVSVQWTSPDGMHWNDERETLDFTSPFDAKPDRGSTGRILLDSWSGPGDEDEIHGGFVFRDGERWLLHYMKWTGDGHIYCGLASSRDGLNFARVERGAPTLPLGQPGTWDAGRIALREAPFRVGDVWRQYYSGACWKHGLGGIGARTSHVGLNGPQQTGLAEIGVGRWVHLQVGPDADAGEVTSIELRLARPHELTVDVEGSALACAVLDPATGAARPGFGYEEFDRVARDGRDVACTWRGKSLKSLGPVAIQLRARLQSRKVKLYGWNLV